MKPLQLETLEVDVWRWLGDALLERESPFRTPVVATVDARGEPEARTVVLRAVDPSTWMLAFHTDVRSSKHASLRTHRGVSWLFYDPVRLLQIRADGEASLHSEDALADAAWAAGPLPSRAPYLADVAPGTPIENPAPGVHVRDEAHSMLGRPRFCAVRCKVRTLDVLQLHAEGHRRARLQQGAARWVAP